MAIAVRDNTSWAVEVESVEGTYVAPQAATSYVQTLEDGSEFSPGKELLERAVFNGSIGKTTPRTGIRTASVTIPVEMKAAATEGAAPEYDALMRSALGSFRTRTASTLDNSDTTGPLDHTTTVMYLADTDANKYAVGDIITVKSAGAFHTSPVSAVDNTPGQVSVTMLVPKAAAPANGDEIAAVRTYVTANSGHPSLSVSKYIEAARLEQASGCKVTSMSLDNFTTGQLASWNFSLEGLDWDSSLTARPQVPVYSTALPPIILSACVYQDGVKIPVNELSISLENELGFATSTCNPNGRFSSRPTARTITGSLTPYKNDDDVANFTKFKANTEFSLSATAYIPSATAGEYGQVVSIYMPQCIITEIAEQDQDGLLQEALTFQATRGNDATSEELFISVS